MRDHERQRVCMFRTNVNEVDVQTIVCVRPPREEGSRSSHRDSVRPREHLHFHRDSENPAILSYDKCTPSGLSSARIVTGAYEPASGTCFTISYIMSGLPITKRRILGMSKPASVRKIAPWSSFTNIISPVPPRPAPTARSSSPKFGQPWLP